MKLVGEIDGQLFVLLCDTATPGGLTEVQDHILRGLFEGFCIAIGKDTLNEDEYRKLVTGVREVQEKYRRENHVTKH